MAGGGGELAKGLFQSLGGKAVGSGGGLEPDATAGADQIHTIRPGSIGTLCPVVDVIEDGGETNAEIAHAGQGRGGAFLTGSGRSEQNGILDIGLHLPEIDRVGLLNVDDVEGDAILVGGLEAVELGNLPAKRRSSVAAEDEGNGPFAPLLGEANPGAVIRGWQVEIRSGIAGGELSGTGGSPQGFERDQHHGRARHSFHDCAEAFRWLAHGPVEARQANHV